MNERINDKRRFEYHTCELQFCARKFTAKASNTFTDSNSLTVVMLLLLSHTVLRRGSRNSSDSFSMYRLIFYIQAFCQS